MHSRKLDSRQRLPLGCLHGPGARAAFAVLALAAALVAPSVQPAFADEGGSATADYLAAVENYQSALSRQASNARSIARVEAQIEEAQTRLEKSQMRLGQASVEMYKNGIQPGELIETVLSAPSLSESIALYDDFAHLEAYRRAQCEDARLECETLEGDLSGLESLRDELSVEVGIARRAVADAKSALRASSNLEGSKYHQTQGNGVNCGATAFTVGVNILLGESRFNDNVKVWESDAFAKDSTVNLVEKGAAWLEERGLDDLIGFKYVRGDVHKADELRELLEGGGVVVISSGSGSEWQRVDAADAKKGLYPAGHFICFYGYRDGIFYANDSAVSAKRGAGCPYTEKQMQQWLDGRSYHAACVLSRKP